MNHLQRGLGAFGTLVVLVIFVVGGYYAYKYVMEPETVSAPSCRGQLGSCIANCRKTSTESPELTACQQRCQRAADECEAKKR